MMDRTAPCCRAAGNGYDRLMQRTCRICGAALPEGAPLTKVFCSERCRLRDLGAWADGTYAVPGEPAGFVDDPEQWEGVALDRLKGDPIKH